MRKATSFKALKPVFALSGAVPALWAITACLPMGVLPGDERDASPGGSVVTSIEGIAVEDRTREGVKFILLCDGAQAVEVDKVGSEEHVIFPAAGLPETGSCAMEIRIPPPQNDKNFIWYGRKKAQSDKGLLYGSNKAVLADKALSLTLYKTYAWVKPEDRFTARFEVSLDTGEAPMPAENATASLTCSGLTTTQAGKFVKGQDKDATLVFDALSILEMRERNCSKLSVLVDNKEAYSAAIDVLVEAGEAGTEQQFPRVAGERYTMKVVAAPNPGDDPVLVDATGRACATTVEDNRCQDLEKAQMSWNKSYVLAAVKGRLDNGKGALATYLVTPGNTGLGIYENDAKTLSIAAIAQNKTAFSWWNQTAASKILGAAFDQTLISAANLQDSKISVPEDFLPLHFEWVKEHGFHKTTTAELNGRSSARWLAVLQASKDGEVKDFIVSGTAAFASAAKPVGSVYLSFGDIAVDLSTGAKERWRFYTVTGGLGSQSCAASLSDYTFGLSLLNDTTMVAPGGSACEIQSLDLTGYEPLKLKRDDGQKDLVFVWDWVNLPLSR